MTVKLDSVNTIEVDSSEATVNHRVHYDIVGSASAFTVNVPLDRALTKLRNLKAASDAETETWAKIALVLGWNTWNVGIDKADSKKKVGKGKKKSSFEGMSLEDYKKYMKNK